MAENPLIQFVSKANFFFILLHAFVSYTLMMKNRKARPIGYKVSAGAANSNWSSRSMSLLGTLILIFLIIHLKGFWFEFKYGTVPTTIVDGVEIDLDKPLDPFDD